MKKLTKNVITLSAGLLLLASCNLQEKKTQQTQEEKVVKLTSIELAQKAKASIFKTYNDKDLRSYFKKDYIQHNPNVASGIEPIVSLLPTLKKEGTTYTTSRVFEDGDFVVMHNAFKNASPLGAKEVVTFDIWRVEDGKIAEHWDAITPVVAETASGRSQIDGATKLTDLDKTTENKALVKGLVENVFIGGKVNDITNYISTEQYDQHNPMVKDGLSGLSEAIQYLSSQNNMFIYRKIHKLLGQGNFVLVQVEGEWNQKPHIFYDLFRVKEGKIVEHWDIVNEIPEKMAHTNGVF